MSEEKFKAPRSKNYESLKLKEIRNLKNHVPKVYSEKEYNAKDNHLIFEATKNKTYSNKIYTADKEVD